MTTSQMENVKDLEEDEENAKIQPEQLNVMLHYLKEHDKFAAGKLLGANGRGNQVEQWNTLATLVSSCGPTKTGKQLKSVWARQKAKSKKYNAEKHRAMRQTGNHTEVVFKVDPQLEKVLDITGTCHKNGLPLIDELGITSSKLKKNRQKNKVVYEFPHMKGKNALSPMSPGAHQAVHCSSYVNIPQPSVPTSVSGTSSQTTLSQTGSSLPWDRSEPNAPAANMRSKQQVKTEAKENDMTPGLNYSQVYSNYASTWRTQKSKKELALVAVVENTNTIGRLVDTITHLKEAEDKKVEVMKKHFAMKERFYEEKEKYYQEKLKILKAKKD